MTEDRRQKTEYRRKTRDARRCGMTLIEIIVSLAIMAIIITVIVPLFVTMRNTWDSKQTAAEALQNGRILIDHLNRNLSKAVRITAVSDSATADGYIQFLDNDGNNLRYDINSTGNYAEFGYLGDLSDLAGPVSQLQFSCYDACDLDTPLDISTADVNDIRFVKAETTLTNSSPLGQDKTLIASAYLRTNDDESSECGLVGWWKLDETSGLTAADSSEYGNNGTLTNMAGDEWTTGRIDGALQFDGTEDYIAVSNSSSLQLTSALTLTAWIKGDAWGSGANVDVIVRKAGSGGSNTYQLAITDGKIALCLDDKDEDGFLGNTVLNTAQWYHVAATWDGSTVRIYVDGVLDNDPPDSRTGSISTNTNDLNIGGKGTTWDLFDGIIDDVRIYNRALDANEIAALAEVLIYQEFTGAKAASDTTSITISTPSDTNEGDLLVTAVATDGDTSASLAPPGGEGWTEIDVDDYGTEVTLGAWWKNADASESPTHQFTWSGAQQAYAWMMRFTGHDPDDPVDVSATSGESSSTPTSPEVTTTVANTIILRLGAFDDDNITVDSPGLSGHTAITMDRSASSSGVLYQEFSEAKQSYGQELTINTPAGTGEGDLLIAAVVTDASETLSPPGGEGWTLIDQGVGDSAVTLGVWWKLADASESPSHQFTWGSNEEAYGWIMRFTGHHSTTPINDSQAQGGGNDSTPPSPSVTTTVANTMILRIGGFDDDDINVDNTGLSGHATITMDESSASNFSCSGGAGWVQQAAIGDSGSVNFSLTKSEEYRTVTIAIAPAPVAGDPVSGGAGYVTQSSSGDSGTSTFTLGSSNEAQMLTIAIAPDSSSDSGCGGQIRP